MKKLLLVLSALLLASCGGGSSSTSSAATSKSVQESSENVVSSVTSVEEATSASATSEEEETSEAATSEGVSSEEEVEESSLVESSEEEGSTEVSEVGAWTIDASCLEETTENSYLFDYSFNVTSKNNETLPFHGDYIQRGAGEWEGLVQMRKYEEGAYGYINSEFSMKGTLTLSVMIRSKYYNNEDHDFTGVPRLYCGSKDDQDKVEHTSVNDENGYRVYTFAVDGYFTLTTSEGNAIYFSTLSFE